MNELEPGLEVATPRGVGSLLHPSPRTGRQEWTVLVGSTGYLIAADELKPVDSQDEQEEHDDD